MQKLPLSLLRSFLIAALACALIAPPPLRAALTATVRADEPHNFYAAFPTAAIGLLETTGEAILDGQPTRAAAVLRGNELIQAPAGGNARLSFPTLGQVVLGERAVARVTAVTVGDAVGAMSRVLVASLIAGQMSVKLDGDASAFIQAGTSGLLALDGASLNVNVSGGETSVNHVAGAVERLGDWQLSIPQNILAMADARVAAAALPAVTMPAPTGLGQRYSLASLSRLSLSNAVLPRVTASNAGNAADAGAEQPMIKGTLAGDEVLITSSSVGAAAEKARWALQLPPAVVAAAGARGVTGLRADYKLEAVGHGGAIYATARAAQPVEVRVTDAKGQPVAGLPVYFELGDSRAGMLTNGAQSGLRVRAVTDARGIAVATLAPADRDVSARLTASLSAQSGDRTQSVGSDVYVQKYRSDGGFTKKKAILVFAAAAAATGLAIALTHNRRGATPVQATPQPTPVTTPVTTPTTPTGGIVICPTAKC